MEKVLLPTEQAELAEATAKVVEVKRTLRESRQSSLRWGLPAIAIAVAVFTILGDMGASWGLRVLMAVVSGFAVSSGIELYFLQKRVAALEVLQELQGPRSEVSA